MFCRNFDAANCQTTLHVELSPRSEEWCVSVTPFEPTFFAQAPVEVDVRTEDEQWRGKYLTTATLDVAQDGSTNVSLNVFQQGMVQSGEALGFSNLQLVPDSEAVLGLALHADGTGTAGSVSVSAKTPPPEESDAGVPEDTLNEVVIEAVIGNATN